MKDTKKESLLQAMVQSRAFSASQEEFISKIIDLVFSQGEELQRLKVQPLALEWINPKQAGQILKRSDKTVRDLARSGAFAIDANPGYQKGKRKMEYYLPGIRKYLNRQNIKSEAIEERIKNIEN